LKPNVVFIMADDMGWGDPGFNNPGSQIPTPAMDKIAAEGIRLTHAHAASSVCSPSRYALLTGRYAWRTRMKSGVLSGYSRHLIEPGRTTLPSVFKDQGYATACIGKWHIGLDWPPREGDPGDWGDGNAVRGAPYVIGHRVDFTKPISNGPTDVGFDYFFGTSGCSTCSQPYTFIENDRVKTIPEYCEDPDYKNAVYRDPEWDHRTVDDTYVDKAVDFMEKNKGKPFFLYLPLSAPHAPLWPPERHQGKSKDGARGDMVCWFDDSVARVDTALERLGLKENTFLIITSDNGGQLNQIGNKAYERLRQEPSLTYDELCQEGLVNPDHRVSGPYRGFKTDIWDGGTRVPFTARWPQKIAAGTASTGEFCLMDMLPTMVEFFGADIPERQAEDGDSRIATLFGPDHATSREELITHSYDGVFALRQGPWKLIIGTEGSGGDRGITPEWKFIRATARGQLYNLEEDPYERNNLWDVGQGSL
jgi:arylsulfatase A-like enzyme